MKKRLIISVVLCLIIIFSTFSGYYVLREITYPRKYKNFVYKYCEKYDVSPSLVFAIIKNESSFNEQSVSVKGAKGLMQITDSTAQYISQMLSVEEYDMLSAESNIMFGTYYLRYLSYKFQGINEIICAYNAGEGCVLEWLNDTEYSEDRITLYKVPYKETSVYLQKVKTYYKKYYSIVGK